MLASIFTPHIMRKGVAYAVSIIAVIESAMTVTGYSLKDLVPRAHVVVLILILGALFSIAWLICCLVLFMGTKNGVSINVGGNNVKIVVGDIFKTNGIKVIPFNERFDTCVDDVVIAHNTLNGIFIDKYVEDLDALRSALSANGPTSLSNSEIISGCLVYPLGTIKVFDDYAILAFTHFNALNEAHLTMPEYEKCLMNMWKELSRVYAGKSIVLPLLGSGVSRFNDTPLKSFDDFLRCMLCTLRTMGLEFSSSITIVLTKEAMQKVHLFEIKTSFNRAGM